MYLEKWLYGPGMPRKGRWGVIIIIIINILMTAKTAWSFLFTGASIYFFFFKFEAAQSLGTLWLKFRLIRNAVDSRFYNSAQIVFDKDQLYHSDTPISLDPFL